MPRYKKWMAVFDNHGDLQDDSAVAAARMFCRWYRPEIRIHGGDCFDLMSLRRDAASFEQTRSPGDDLERGTEFLGWYRPTHFLRGNHDERLWDALSGEIGGELRGPAQALASHAIAEIEATLGSSCVTLPYDKRRGLLKLGHLKFVHGYSVGQFAAKRCAEIYGSCVMGHIHTIDMYSIAGIERRIGRAAGCLCRLDQKYNRGQILTLRQAHGWAYGILYGSGDYVYWQAERVAGRWVFPSEL